MNSKKGFTLIELVVVIAILAILAAIAVPAVITIVNNASASSQLTEATTIDQCCKTYYEQVKTGMITKESFSADQSGDNIPPKLSSLRNKAVLAKNCTVGGALEYNGLYAKFVGNLDEFAYDGSGNVVAVIDGNVPDGCTQISADGKTTFSEMHYVDR